VNAYPCRRVGACVVGGGIWALLRTWFAMTQLIMCAVLTWRRVCVVVVEGVACDRGDRRRGVGGNDLSSESSSMMARVCTRAGALVGELAPLSHAGCWTSSGLHITTGSSSIMGYGALICGGVGEIGGTLPRSSICRAWIAASLLGGASWTPSIAVVRCAIASRILSVAMMLGTGMAWWQKRNVSVMSSPPVLAIKTQMQW